MSCVRCLGRGHHRGRAEGRWGENSGDGAGMQEEEEKGRYCEDKSGGKQDKPASPQSIKAVLGHPQPLSHVLQCMHWYKPMFYPEKGNCLCLLIGSLLKLINLLHL